MIEQRQSDFKSLKAFAIGGQPKDRAALCYAATAERLAVEPLGSIDELTPADLISGDAFFIWADEPSISDLRERLVTAGSFAPIICFAAQLGAENVISAIDAGACSFVEVPFSQEKILSAIQSASEKSSYLGTSTRRALAAKFRLKVLSPREREVLNAVADGVSNKLIGRKLQISSRTVEVHRANAFAKLNISHTAEAVRLVLEASYYEDLRGHAESTKLG